METMAATEETEGTELLAAVGLRSSIDVQPADKASATPAKHPRNFLTPHPIFAVVVPPGPPEPQVSAFINHHGLFLVDRCPQAP